MGRSPERSYLPIQAEALVGPRLMYEISVVGRLRVIFGRRDTSTTTVGLRLKAERLELKLLAHSTPLHTFMHGA
jgi:hypothetical protein